MSAAVTNNPADNKEELKAENNPGSEQQPDTPANKTKKPKKLNKRKIKWIKATAGVRSKPSKPIFPDNTLSIVERFFHHSPPNSSQIVMAVATRVVMPRLARHLSVKRLIEIAKLTSAEMYRTSCILDYETHTLSPMGSTAADIRVNYNFTVFENDASPMQVAQKVLNHKFDMKDTSLPCWKIDIIGPKEMDGDGFTLDKDSNELLPKFYMFFSFHHCLGDGLSAFSYARLYFSKMDAYSFNAESLHLDKVPLSSALPPLLDNYINPNFFGVVPAIIELLGQQIRKAKQKPYRLKQFAIENTANTGSESESNAVHQTGIRHVIFDEQFSADMLQNTRHHKTTLSGVIIVAALAAVRISFTPRVEKAGKSLPKYTSWVCTSSMRHLLPNSKLLEGADKESDPSIMEFGGYGGSISDEQFKFSEKSELWSRSKAVRNQITGQFFKSMRRLKLTNYTYRKQALWKKLQKQLDLQEITRSYSVEVANMGSWEYPISKRATGPDDTVTMDWFFGSQNNSFLGARALFSLAVISIGNTLSILISYDMASITEVEADAFVKAFEQTMQKMRTCSDPILLQSL